MKRDVYTPWLKGAHIKVVVGHYGSGKTEFALNMALAAKRAGRDVLLVDLDIVNPFFRSAEHSDLLESEGIELIYPPYAKTGVDVPILSAEILSLFEKEDRFVVVDVGGDDAGATALGRFFPQFEKSGYDMLYVVNLFRPYSENEDEIYAMLRRIEARSRLRVTALIDNANLGHLTRAEDVRAGIAPLKAVCARSGIPIEAVCALDKLLPALEDLPYPLFPIKRITTPEWMKDEYDDTMDNGDR